MNIETSQSIASGLRTSKQQLNIPGIASVALGEGKEIRMNTDTIEEFDTERYKVKKFNIDDESDISDDLGIELKSLTS